MRDGSEFAKVPISRRRRRLSATSETNWIDGRIRMQANTL